MGRERKCPPPFKKNHLVFTLYGRTCLKEMISKHWNDVDEFSLILVLNALDKFGSSRRFLTSDKDSALC